MNLPLHEARSGDQMKLLAHLAETIGTDVEKSMDSINWEHSMTVPKVPAANPDDTKAPPPDALPPNDTTTVKSGETQPNVTSPPITSTGIDWEQFRDPKNNLIMGKYKDAESATKGMHSLLHMAKAALSERDSVIEEMNQLRQRSINSPPAVETTEKAAPNVRSPKLDVVLAKLKQGEGLSADDIPLFVEGTTEQAEMAAREIIRKDKEWQGYEQEQWNKVDDYMSKHHPESMRFVDEMRLHVKAKPEINRVFNRLLASPDEGAKLDATLYAWNEFARANPHVLEPSIDAVALAKEKEVQANAEVRKEEVEKARKDAGLLGTSASGVHETTKSSGPTQEELQAAIARHNVDNGQAWRALTIVPQLTHPIFDNP